MAEPQELPDFDTIQAAIAGESWATEKILAHYDAYITELSTMEIRQPDGSIKKVLDEDLKQQISLKLLEEIPHFTFDESEGEENE